MDSYLLLTLMMFLIFDGGHCYSESMSCSMVNGKWICEKQTGSGNVAGAVAGAHTGAAGESHQEASAIVGDTRTGNSQLSRTVIGNNRFEGYELPALPPNGNSGFSHLIGTGASEATSFHSDTSRNDISASGFAGASNNYGNPGPAFAGASNNYGNPGPVFGGFAGANNNYGNREPAIGGIAGASNNYGNREPAFGGFAGASNNYGNPGPAFGGFAGASNNYGNPEPAFGGFAGASNKYGNPGPAFGGFGSNSFLGGGNIHGGGHAYGYGNPHHAFDPIRHVFPNSAMHPGFPFNVFGRKR